MNPSPTRSSSSDRIVVVGLGLSGLSCIEFLVGTGLQLVVADTRNLPPGLAELRARYPQLPCYLGEQFSDALVGATQLLLSPGVPREQPAVAAACADGVEVIGDIELFARHAKAPVVAITGSNGKSTVTALLGHLLKGAGLNVRVGGNLGLPALQLIEADEPDAYVLELSSFQLESTSSLSPRVAALLNLSPDHLDRYADMAAYCAAKARIFDGADYGVINADDALVEGVIAGLQQPTEWLRFSTEPDRDGVQFGVMTVEGEQWLHQRGRALIRVSELSQTGVQGLANSLAALAMGSVLMPEIPGLLPDLLPGLSSFVGLPHRLELVAETQGVRWIDDSKATNPGAVEAAIRSVASNSGRLFLIAGGVAKGADFSALRGQIESAVETVILIGRDAPRLRRAWAGAAELTDVLEMARAVALAAKLAKPGDTVLLSPACASQDQYQNYVERGLDFQRLVRTQTQPSLESGQ